MYTKLNPIKSDARFLQSNNNSIADFKQQQKECERKFLLYVHIFLSSALFTLCEVFERRKKNRKHI